jgi:hypothetical protein
VSFRFCLPLFDMRPSKSYLVTKTERRVPRERHTATVSLLGVIDTDVQFEILEKSETALHKPQMSPSGFTI